MHRVRSKSVIHRFRLAAVLLCAKCILTPVAAGVLIYSTIVSEKHYTYLGIGIVILAMLVIVLQWIFAARTHCPLCMTPVLASKHCAKHNKARTFLGSHRLRVALTVIFKNSFRCPYCHEPTVLEVRDRNNSRSYSRG